jgi:hypothetical protein
MAERNISEAEVRQVVEHHDVRVNRRDGRVDYIGQVGQRRLKVVTDERSQPPQVVTVFEQ